MHTKLLVVGVGVVTAVGLTSAALIAQSSSGAPLRASAPVGRFQLVRMDVQGTFLVDTSTGRVWRYTLLTAADNNAADPKDNPCEGLDTCFLEVDRRALAVFSIPRGLTRTDPSFRPPAGWARSEIVSR